MPERQKATLECTKCGESFTTSARPDGSVTFDGVREHGRQHHTDERWDYEIIDRP